MSNDYIDLNPKYQTATFAMGWFWGPDAQFGHLAGVIRTRVGYAGGTKENPTYHNLGDHTETIQLDYDPDEVSFLKLLDIFWYGHYPIKEPWSRQYMSIIFYHNEEQKALAYETKDKMEKELKSKVYTVIRPAAPFYMAEDYHQKYYLQQFRELKMALRGNFSTFQEFVDATITARTNGFVAGYGPWQELVNIIRPLDNHEAIIQILNHHKIRA